jgi:hypothetical protein
MLICFMVIWNMYLGTIGIFYDHLVQFVFIWYILFGFGIMHQEKSGSPARNCFFYTSAIAAEGVGESC